MEGSPSSEYSSPYLVLDLFLGSVSHHHFTDAISSSSLFEIRRLRDVVAVARRIFSVFTPLLVWLIAAMIL